jgi:uncharacterized protein
MGSLLVLPSGMRAWRPNTVMEMGHLDFVETVREKQHIDILLIGTGKSMERLPSALMSHLTAQGFSVDLMPTSSAIHVYNVVLVEGRRVAAALLAVD